MRKKISLSYFILIQLILLRANSKFPFSSKKDSLQYDILPYYFTFEFHKLNWSKKRQYYLFEILSAMISSDGKFSFEKKKAPTRITSRLIFHFQLVYYELRDEKRRIKKDTKCRSPFAVCNPVPQRFIPRSASWTFRLSNYFGKLAKFHFNLIKCDAE